MARKKAARKTARKTAPRAQGLDEPLASRQLDEPVVADEPASPTRTKAVRPIVEGTKTRCPRSSCQSTDRDEYFGVVRKEISGVDKATGQPYTHVVWRRTRCRACGQVRVDRHVEYRPEPRGAESSESEEAA